MFHLPASVLGGGYENDTLALSAANDENLIYQHEQHQQRNAHKTSALDNYETNKTPGTKSSNTRRRALGDISNKKQNPLGFRRGLVVQSSQKPVLKPRSSNNVVWHSTPSKGSAKSILPKKTENDVPQRPVQVKTPTMSSKPMIPRISAVSGRTGDGNFTANLPSFISRQSQEASKKKEKPSLKPSRPVLATLSSNTLIPKSAPSQFLHKSTTVNNPTNEKYTSRMEEPIPDIELPAGRTWKQQLEHDLKGDDDDIASTSSIDDILMETLGSRSMWDDWKESMRKHHQEEGEKLDRISQTEIDAMLAQDERDYQRGIESLCDIVDGFSLFGFDDEIDLQIKDDISGDNDEWSLPASSMCGPAADDSFFKL
jgi:hypothetical protein